MHPIYKKFVTTSKKYAAHDVDNRHRVGDAVRIEESRPISKRKCWVVLGGPADAAPGRRSSRSVTERAAVEAGPPDLGPQDLGVESVEPAGGGA